MRADLRQLNNRRRYAAKPYGTAMDTLTARLPEEAKAVRAYVSALHHQLGAARIQVRELRAQAKGDRDE